MSDIRKVLVPVDTLERMLADTSNVTADEKKQMRQQILEARRAK